MTRPVVVGIGELLWDCFPDSRRPGGAPANLAYHATLLGAEGVVVSRVGADADGHALREFLDEHGLDTTFVQEDPEHMTGTVEVEVNAGQPTYHIRPDVAWDWIDSGPALDDLMTRAGAVCYGTLAQRRDQSRATLQAAVRRAREHGALTVYDVNLRQSFYTPDRLRDSLALAEVVKLNEAEVKVVAALLERAPVEELEFSRLLLEEFGVQTVCITRAERGCALGTAAGLEEFRGVEVEVADAVGAGDAFTAAFVVAVLEGHAPAVAAPFANAVGALVASHSGAMPNVQEAVDVLRRVHLPASGD